LGVQVLVSRAQGQSIRLPNDWLNNELNIKIQVANHATQDDGLLGILLSKHSAVRPNDIEEFEDNCCHTTKMSWPRNTAEPGTEAIHSHEGAVAFRIYFRHRRKEHSVDPTLLEQRE